MNQQLNIPEVKALISLLDDPNYEAFEQVSNRFFTIGMGAVTFLEEAWEDSLDENVQHRIEELIHQIQYHEIYKQLSTWAGSKEPDLLEGFLIATRYRFFDLTKEKILPQIANICTQTWIELNDDLTPIEQVRVLNHIFFDVMQFTGVVGENPTTEDYFLNNLLDSKRGNPTSLGILYLLIAQRLEIPLMGVDLPRHFILAYTDSVLETGGSEQQVKFYINPFARGIIFTEREIGLYLHQIGVEPLMDFYTPCSNKAVLRRMLLELAYLYELEDNLSKKKELTELANLLG